MAAERGLDRVLSVLCVFIGFDGFDEWRRDVDVDGFRLSCGDGVVTTYEVDQ